MKVLDIAIRRSCIFALLGIATGGVMLLAPVVMAGENHAGSGYCSLGAGGGGAGGGSGQVSAEVGWRYEQLLVGVGNFLILNRDDIPPDLLGSAASGDFTTIGRKKPEPESGFFGKAGWEIFPTRGLYLCALAGLSWYREYDIAFSNPDHRYYLQYAYAWNPLVVGAGLTYFSADGWGTSLAYDNRRGITVSAIGHFQEAKSAVAKNHQNDDSGDWGREPPNRVGREAGALATAPGKPAVSLEASAPAEPAQIYLAMGGGGGGALSTGNFSLGGGRIRDGFLAAVSADVIFNREVLPADAIPYPAPNDNYTSAGRCRNLLNIGLDTKFGFDVFGGKGLYLFALGGISAGAEYLLVRSSDDARYYLQSSAYTIAGFYGGGLGYFPKTSRNGVSLAYDTLRGVTLELIFRMDPQGSSKKE